MKIHPIKAARHNYKIKEDIVLSLKHEFIQQEDRIFHLEGSFSLKNEMPHLKASLNGEISLICQNTMMNYPFKIDWNIDLYIVKLGRLLEEDIYNYFTYEGEEFYLEKLIEEDIYINIPSIPKYSTS